MKKITIFLAILFATNTTTQAQLGGLLKKAKDKVTEKKTASTASSTETITNSEVVKTTVTGSSTTYSLYSQQYGYSSGGNKVTLAQLIAQKKLYSPYEPIRKVDETGTFHFVKDYPELAPIMEPIDNNVSITFSNQPYSGAKNNVEASTKFASNNYIYAKISVAKGTIRDALKIGEKDNLISMGFTLYTDNPDNIKTEESALGFEITAAQADAKSITVDIRPWPQLYNLSRASDFWPGFSFVALQTQYNMPKNGTYKIEFFVKNEKADDWGKPIWGDNIVYKKIFDYDFNNSDVDRMNREVDTLNDLRVSTIKNAITPLPKQWTEKTSSPVMGFTQAQLITMYQNSFDTKLDPHTVVKFHASNSSGGYTTQNNEYGIPIYRYSNQWYTIFVKYANGKSCFYQGFGLRQQYNGGGTYGKVFIDKNEYHMADCAGMK